MERSGKQSWVHWRCQCPKFLRQTFVEWATGSIRFSGWARAYYEQQRAKGASHQAAVRALAFKWLRIVFHYTPKHASWMHQIELWFSILVRKLLRRASGTSVEDLQARVLAFVEYFNTTMAKPFKGTYGQKPLHV